MPTGNGENNDANKKCSNFKNDLKDALDQLDAIWRSKNLPNNIAKQTKDLQKMLLGVKQYTEDNRFYHKDAESLPKRR